MENVAAFLHYRIIDFIIYFVLIRNDNYAEWLDVSGSSPEGVSRRNTVRFINLFQDRKIQAIKEVRTAAGVGLVDAKRIVEQIYLNEDAARANFRNQIVNALKEGRDEDAERLMAEFRSVR